MAALADRFRYTDFDHFLQTWAWKLRFHRTYDDYRLIGVSEFDLPAHKGHTVLVKGLFIKATPVSRVNITSVTMVSTACAAAPK